MVEPLPTGSVIGILGGGQLGRMLAAAAARLGYRAHIFAPAPAPAADVAAEWTEATFDDQAALARFAAGCDVITYEFENIPTTAVSPLDAPAHRVYPPVRALEVSQDRLDEKRFLADLGLGVARFAPVSQTRDLEPALAITGLPALLKTRRFGYDGKGQARITTLPEAVTALEAMAGASVIAEAFVPFDTEISVIVARGQDGSTAAYDPGENLHAHGILRRTTVPAQVPNSLRTQAVFAAAQITNALDYVGVLGVEFFVTAGRLLVNEFAPRVHNSGHWTQLGCTTDQFEQHIRAITGWPLSSAARHADVEMRNLIGSESDQIFAQTSLTNAQIHLYGKGEPRAGRKMGHVNRIWSPNRATKR